MEDDLQLYERFNTWKLDLVGNGVWVLSGTELPMHSRQQEHTWDE
jgi:hypothetical protein